MEFVGNLYIQNKRLYVQGEYIKVQAFTAGWQDVATLPFASSQKFRSVGTGWRGGTSPATFSIIVEIFGDKLRAYFSEDGMQEAMVDVSFSIS